MSEGWYMNDRDGDRKEEMVRGNYKPYISFIFNGFEDAEGERKDLGNTCYGIVPNCCEFHHHVHYVIITELRYSA